MHVSGLLDVKGTDVATAQPGATVAEVAQLLAEHRIGAVVVSPDGAAIAGVVSERDIVRAVAAQGADALAGRVDEIMTREVFTCEPSTTVEQLMALMTQQRIRHIPVVSDGALAGIVSIGDVVKDRVGELETETQVLHEYIENGR